MFDLATTFDLFPPLPRYRARRIETPPVRWWPTWDSPAADIHETDDQIEIHLDVPGVPRDAISVELDRQELVISGTRAGPDGARRTGEFSRRYRLSDNLDHDNISAQLQDGVLTVRVPRRADQKPRRIEITA